ncbi:MAG: aggregation factor core, partial [Pseudomonadota bacterium]
MLRTAALLALFSGSAAIADVTISFEESAPKDRFVLSHDGACSLGPLDVVIDLGGSAGRLIFDPTATGAGVE